MIKQNKKGRVAKSTLSVVLAASMVLTSSSFVWAAPVEEVETTAIVEEVVGQVPAEEVVGAAQVTLSFAGSNEWGNDLTASGGTTYAWYRADANGAEGTLISGQVAGTYKTTMEDAGKFIYAIADDDPTTKSDYVSVAKIELTDTNADFALTNATGLIYDGTAKKPDAFTIYKDGTQSGFDGLTDADVSLDWDNNINAGTASAKATISGAYYTGTLTADFKIAAMDISKYSAKINNAISPQPINNIKPNVENVTFTKTDNAYGGAASVTVTDSANFTGFTYKVTPPVANAENEIATIAGGVNLTNTCASVTNGEFDILAETINPVVKTEAGWKDEYIFGSAEFVKATMAGNIKVYATAADAQAGSNALRDNTDYELKFQDDWNTIGKKTITITGKGNYSFTTTLSYSVAAAAADIKATDIELDGQAALTTGYNGGEIKPKVTVAKSGYTGAKEGVDFTVEYRNNINVYEKPSYTAGYSEEAPQAVITFIGSLAGTPSVTKYFAIEPLTLSRANTQINADADQKFPYDGTAKQPAIKSIVVTIPGKTLTLVEGQDYTIGFDATAPAALTKDKAVNAGTYTAEIIPDGNFDGNLDGVKITFSIAKKTFSSDTVNVVANTMSYTGGEVVPKFTVTDKETGAVVPEASYDVKYVKDSGAVVATFPTEPGTYTATLVSKAGGNFTEGGSVKASYTVSKRTLEAAVVTFDAMGGTFDTDVNSFKYDAAKGQVPTVASIMLNGTRDISRDCEIVYPKADDCKNVGTYTVTINGKGDYYGESITKSFKIEPKEITAGMITSVVAELDSTGSLTAPYATIKDGDYTLVQDKDYSLAVDTTAKTATITGMGNYATEKPITRAFTTSTIMNIANPIISVTFNQTYTYDGKAKTPKASEIVIAEANGKALVADKHYTVGSYKSNTNAGTATLVVTGRNGYTGTRTVEFTIEAAAIESAYSLDMAKVPALNVANNYTKAQMDGNMDAAVKAKAGITKSNNNYEFEYLYNDKVTTTFNNAGDYTINVKGRGNYAGTLSGTIHINGTPLSTVANVPSTLPDQEYTGKAIEPEVTINLKNSATKLVEGKDFKVSYKNNTDIGEALAVVEGMGKYDGQYLVTFNITGVDISKATVTVDGTYTYTGEAITPTVVVKVGDTVIDAVNYDVKATDNTNAGTAKFTVVGKNNCTGTTKEATFEIAKADQELAVSKGVTDALKIRNTNANTYILKVIGAETKLSYKSSNTKIATVSSAGKLSFKHICGKATITVTAAADDNHNAATLKVAVAVKPATPKIEVAAKTKGFNVKATVIKDITGYQVGYSRKADFNPVTKKLVKTTKALNKDFSGLSAKKGYYVRVRAYKKVGSTVYWGNWTSAKKITTK